jgi:hypothetical protein
MKHTKKLLPLKEENYISKYHDINIKIHKKFIDMGLGEDISFEQFLLNLQINEFLACKEFHLHMRQLINEQKTILVIFYTKKLKTQQDHFIFF